MGTSSFLERKLGKELYVAERGAEPPLRPVGTGNFVSAIFSFPASAFLRESWAKNFTSRPRAAEPPLRPVGTGNFVSAIFSFPASAC